MFVILFQSKLNCEVLHEPLGYEVRWAIAGDSIVVQLVAKLGKLYKILRYVIKKIQIFYVLILI